MLDIWVSEARKRQLNYEEALYKFKKVVSFEEVLKLVDEAAEMNAELQSSIYNAFHLLTHTQDPSMEKTPEKSPIDEPVMIKERPEKDLIKKKNRKGDKKI